MAMRANPRRRRTALTIGFALTLVAFAAAVPREVSRLVMLGLFIVMWLSMIGLDRLEHAQGRTSGLRTYIWVVGVGLIGLVLILWFDR